MSTVRGEPVSTPARADASHGSERKAREDSRGVLGAADDALLTFGDASQFCWRMTKGVIFGRVRAYGTEVLRQATLFATGSVLVVLGLVFAFGLVIAIGDLREITPYAFGYMMAAKVSTGYVAEIGTMRITDEIDAIDVMGLDSMLYLCSTRLLAVWIILPFLYGIAVIVAYIGSYFSVVLEVGQVSSGGYLDLFWKFQTPTDFLFSGTKGLVMATFVVLVGCYYGYRVRGGPVEVGRATAKAMVVNLMGVQVIGILGSQLFWGGAPRVAIGG
ncbi:MAG: MlaE family ABC transporter permease [Solirubrobacteraceae bacterium]